MRVAVYSTKAYDRDFLNAANSAAGQSHELIYHESPLNIHTVILASDCDAVCCFVNDHLDSAVLELLAQYGIKLVALRCAGFNQVDVLSAKRLGICIARVPEYSPHAIAEHALGLILTLNRNLHRAYHRVRENDYSLNGLMGFDLLNKTVAVLGTGNIGQVFAKIMLGLGCKVLAYDPLPKPELVTAGITYCDLATLWSAADIISLHCPLKPDTYHMINAASIAAMKSGVMLINTGRGGLVDTRAVINALKTRKIGYLGLDVYEEEGDLFFEDNSNELLQDDIFARLLTFPNVIVTGHQAFFTREAVTAIANTTIANITFFERDQIAHVHSVN